MTDNDMASSSRPSRREFLKTTRWPRPARWPAAWPSLAAPTPRGSDMLRIGLVGCGGRGAGAPPATPWTPTRTRKLVAMADAFADRLARQPGRPAETLARAASPLTPEHCFVGFDAYQKLIAQRRRRGDPGHHAALPAHAPEGLRRGRQARVLREAGGGRRPGRPQRSGHLRGRPPRRT